jgi:hypothetical protein
MQSVLKRALECYSKSCSVASVTKRLHLQAQNYPSFNILNNKHLVYSGAHPASYPIGTGGRALSQGVKQQACRADHSPPSSAEINKT